MSETTGTVSVLFWMDTALEMDQAGVNDLLAAIAAFRSYIVEHKSALGFSWGVIAPPIVNWWDGKAPRFDCRAKAGCRVWKVPVVDGTVNFSQSLAATPEWAKEEVGYHMDVWEVRRPGGWLPDWFVVYRATTFWLVCLAGDTTPVP